MARAAILCPALVILLTPASVCAQTEMSTQTNSAVNIQAITGPISQAPADQRVTYSGHEWTTPNAQGSYFGGANPCLVGTGAGAAGGPIALSLNVGRSDEGCQRRSDAAAWHAMGFDNVAVARMCQDLKSADAFFAATGQACPGSTPGRYKLADGSAPATASLVANSRAIAGNVYAGPIDLSNPAVQAAIHAEAQKMLQAEHRITPTPMREPPPSIVPMLEGRPH
ncbi:MULTISPECIES: hypothetical protein [unclassified Sphingomonas]|uniref:hypothetical protein n=1 Tax=unclassified Sphingomonas TaxID=196159 RepID=UPI00226A3EC0|nr:MULTISPECIES: hypothetical protein [unclassified Sphingomonas]